MARLTLDENGAKRRFKLNPGKLTIGSGDGATLRLASPQVADLHAELLFEAGVARIRPRPGVIPPTIGGKAVTGETVIAGGQAVSFGSASILVEYDEGEGPKGAKPTTGAARGQVGSPRSAPTSAPTSAPRGAPRDAPRGASERGPGSGAGRDAARPAAGGTRPTSARGAGRAAAASADPDRGVVRSQRRQVKRGMPTWAILAIVGVGLALLLFFGGDMWSSTTAPGFNPVGAKARFEDYWRDGDSKGAAAVLEEFERADLSPEWKTEYERMRGLIAANQSSSSQGLRDAEATREWQNQLENYFTTHLEGKATRPKARIFVRRLQSFRERYPSHEKRDWVDRMYTRFAPVAQLEDPSTLEDVQWEVNRYTIAKPKRFKEAQIAVDQFLATATGTDRDEALKLKAEIETEQRKFFDEQILDAAILYDKVKWPNKFDAPRAIEVLVQLVIGMADQELADDAARRLVQMPEITILEGYKRERFATFERLIENAIVRERAKELGLLE